MSTRIFRPAKTAMQSGQGKGRKWVLEFDLAAPRSIDPLMGWTSSGDTLQQVRLTFETLEEATAHARRLGVPFQVETPHEPKRRGISYSNNFKYDRAVPWSH